jgi:hypothetical protein
VDRDGRNIRQITGVSDAPHGAMLPKFDAGGRLAYLVRSEWVGKRRPADLVIAEGKAARVAIKGAVIADYAWGPDGKAIAYSKSGAVVFHDTASGEEQEVALKGIDERLSGHAAVRICWSPDGRAVACGMLFWGGRQQGNKMFGDDEVFVIPRVGKPNWFQPGEQFLDLEWVGEKPEAQPRPAPVRGEAEPQAAAGEWSEPADGLRGRLLLAQGRTLADGKALETLVYVELENVAGTHPRERAVYFAPGELRCKLAHADGRTAPEYPFGDSGGRGGPGEAWVTLPDDSLIRLRANPSGYGSPDGLHIALSNGNYLIKTGDPDEYHLSGTLTITPPAGHNRADAWAGSLKLPAVKLKAPAPARPTVTDATSGITAVVKENGRTVSARDRDGRALWEADVIRTAGIPVVGQPVVRDLHLKGGKLTAVFGKHAFADFDLATGKFLGAGSD